MDIQNSVRRIAVIGAGGLLGQRVAAEAAEAGCQVLGTYHDSPVPPSSIEVAHLDITDPDETRLVLKRFSPEWVVHTSALTNVDLCERNPSKAWSVNAEGTLNVVQACGQIAARMLYVSTDYVFNGMKGQPYEEHDQPDPVNIYGKTKLEGERLVTDSSTKNVVARVSVLYGWNRVTTKQNFATWVIDSLRKGREVSLFTDQVASPTYVPYCAAALIELMRKGSRGIYHVSGPECVSRYDFGLKIAGALGLDASLVKKAATEGSGLLARRPPRSCLAVGKIEGELGMKLRPIDDCLRHMREERG